jgi:hypothetical protein
LRLADPPDLALDDRADLVITSNQIAILNPAVFDRLFSDIRALLNDIPANVVSLESAYKQLPLSDESKKALEAVLNRTGFAGDSISWEGWGHVETVGQLPEGAAGACGTDGRGDPPRSFF